MNIIKPKPLKKGDTIGLLSVAGNLDDSCLKKLELAKKYFTDKGYNVVISNTSYLAEDYLAGNDNARAQALNNFFSDNSIDAILATRGGYGSIRILDKINYNLIKNNPKIFVGYSDITALLVAIYLKTGMITYHGAMACCDFAEEVTPFTEAAFFDSIENRVHEFYCEKNSKIYNKQNIEAYLLGGNLATLTSMLGGNLILQNETILFLEDINEPVYKIDKMITQLFNCDNIKKHVKALVLGDFTNIDNEKYFNNFLSKFAQNTKLPIISGFKIGHEKEKLTLPIGVKSRLDCGSGCISIITS